MIRHILNVYIPCGWCWKMFDPSKGRCPTCQRDVYTPRA